jgi:hypothetical protein
MGEQETERRDEEQVEERGGDSPESKGDERDFDKEVEEAKEEVKNLEEDPPKNLEDWPSGRAKYETFGGPEHETSYEEAATAKLGPSDVRFYEDGTVTKDGEEVDDPDEFKGDPIPGGPTDPNAPSIAGEKDYTEDDEEDEDAKEE